MKKNIVVLGGTSFTGSHVKHLLGDKYNMVTVGRDDQNNDHVFDLEAGSIESLSHLFENADFVLNCFSNGDVDKCEQDPTWSSRINYDLPRDLVNLQSGRNFHLIHLSTNAVYDGNNPSYSEESPHEPVNIYGQLKSKADEAVRSSSGKTTILRPITMFGNLLGNQRHNPFSFFLQQLLDGKDIVGVNDVYVNMLDIGILVSCIDKVLEHSIEGEFNISGDDVLNRYEFVNLIKKYAPESASKVTQTNSDGFVTPAKRPLNTSFDNSKMKEILGVIPDPIDSTISRMVDQELLNMSDSSVRKAA